MIWFEYKYISSYEIIERTKLLTEFSIIDIATLIILFIVTISMIFYIIPYLDLYSVFLSKQKEKKNRKELIRKIKLQKDIEDSIAKELNIK